MASVLITGCAQGIGLEFARQYAESGWDVVAVTRTRVSEATAKSMRGTVHWHAADIGNREEVAAVARQCAGKPVDVLINNAGIHGPADFGRLDSDAWLRVLRVNLIGSMQVTEAFLPNVRLAKKGRIAFISSRAGSIGERGTRLYHHRNGSYVYRSSKAALNAAAASLAFDLAPEGIPVLVLHPGYIVTATSGWEGSDDIRRNVELMRGQIAGMAATGKVRFIAFDGTEIPW